MEAPCLCVLFFFFFSSRRRHTRLTCDWSSDVCSSDLARQERSRYLGVGGHVKAGVDGGEEGLLPFECGAAIEADVQMSAQFALWMGAAGCSFDQRVLMVLAWHCNFSANCLRA